MADEDDDRRVWRRSNKECREFAARLKDYYGVKRRWPVQITSLLRSGKILTWKGEKPLKYIVVDDAELGKKDATTELIDGIVTIKAKRSVDFRADLGVGRDRMTLAHELGHAAMHAEEGAVDNRGSGSRGTTTLSELSAAESAEHQAKIFAAAFLIDDVRARELSSAEAISEEFIISLEAAKICFERLVEETERAASVDRVLQANAEFQKQMKEPAQRFLDIPCVSCKSVTLVPVGIKVLCGTCGYVGDHPQSGDPSA